MIRLIMASVFFCIAVGHPGYGQQQHYLPYPQSLDIFFSKNIEIDGFSRTSLSHEFQDSLCIDFAGMGWPIQKMPLVGLGKFLDAGQPCHDITGDGAAIIVDKRGKVFAAALYLKKYLPGGYAQFQPNKVTNPRLLIFLKSQEDSRFYVNIFVHWQEQFLAAQASDIDWLQKSVVGADKWQYDIETTKVPTIVSIFGKANGGTKN